MSGSDPNSLPRIPLVETGPDFPLETLEIAPERARALIDGATRGIPRRALVVLDAVSRRWLSKWHQGHLTEIDGIARSLNQPGAYFLSVNYEWGCTTGVQAGPDGGSARLIRVLDWRTPGLGRYVMAARVKSAVGPFVTLTWPGYTGVLQGSAEGRFAAAINQAPMPKRGGGVYPFDWLANKARLWRTPHVTPAHLLRRVFETARDFRDARELLIGTPIAAPAIYSLVGLDSSELCIVERSEEAANVYDGPAAAANAWQAPGWSGRPRGSDSAGRTGAMMHLKAVFGAPSDWVAPPILNDLTRLVMVAEPAQGRLVAQGFEDMRAVTGMLDIAGSAVSATASDSPDPLETRAQAS